MKYLVSLALVAVLTLAYAGGNYTVTNERVVEFSTSGVTGTFDGFEGVIEFDPGAPEEAVFDVTVVAKTIQTGNKTKDRHARGASWLNVGQHPEIRFVSERIHPVGDSFEAVGKLSLHGETRDCVIAFTHTDGMLSGSTTVDRKKYGISGPFLAGPLVGRNVVVNLRYRP